VNAVAAALLVAASVRPAPDAVAWSLEAGPCVEQVPPGSTQIRSKLAVGTTARVSAAFQFSRPCGGGHNRVSCSAPPLRVTTAGGVNVASVRGTTIQLKARTAGTGEVTVRAHKKQFPPLALHAAVPVALAARLRSATIAFPELRALRIVEGGTATISLYPVDESRAALCAGGRVAVSAPALGIMSGAGWDLESPREVRARGRPGWSFLDLTLGRRHVALPVEIVPAAAIVRLALEPHPAPTGVVAVAIRAWDEVGEVIGAPVRLWVGGDGVLAEAGNRAMEVETSGPEVTVIPSRPGATLIVSAQLPNGVTGRADLNAAGTESAATSQREP
jgi:hypothetical protein